MSIEAALAALTAAVEANTAAIKAAGGAPAATAGAEPEKKGRGRPPKEEGAEKTTKSEPEGKYTKDEMTAALNEVKEKKGVADAKGIIKTVGKQDKMVDIVDPKIVDAVYLACQEALKGKAEEEDDDM
jgi:hypothetical protein